MPAPCNTLHFPPNLNIQLSFILDGKPIDRIGGRVRTEGGSEISSPIYNGGFAHGASSLRNPVHGTGTHRSRQLFGAHSVFSGTFLYRPLFRRAWHFPAIARRQAQLKSYARRNPGRLAGVFSVGDAAGL